MRQRLLAAVIVLMAAPVFGEVRMHVGAGSVDAGFVTGRPMDLALDVSVQVPVSKYVLQIGLRKEDIWPSSIGYFLDASIGEKKPWKWGLTRTFFAGGSFGIATNAYAGFSWSTDGQGRTTHQRWKSIANNGGIPGIGADSPLEGPTVMYPFVGAAVERPAFWRFTVRAELRLGFVRTYTAESSYDPEQDRLVKDVDERFWGIMPAYRIALGWTF